MNHDWERKRMRWITLAVVLFVLGQCIPAVTGFLVFWMTR